MPIDGGPKSKAKRMAMMRRGRSGTESDFGRTVDYDRESLLPTHVRTRLDDLFGQIDREFENVYAENLALHEKIEILNERLEAAGGDKVLDVDHSDSGHGSKYSAAMKRFAAGSQISQKLKSTYKTSTSKIVSSFKTAPMGCQLVQDFRGHKDGVWEVNVSRSDMQIIGTASADHTARLWMVETGSCLLQYVGHNGSVNSLRFHPTQDLVLTGSGDKSAHIWKAQISVPTQVETLKSHSSGEDELEGSEKEDADGVDSSDDRHELPSIRQPLLEFTGHVGAVIAADWFYGGSQVISASWDRTAILYDVEKNDIIQTLTGHDQELTNVSAHSSQKLIVTSSKDTTFRLWDFRDPALKVNVFQGHTQPVTTAVFAHGDKVISGSDDRTVKVWDLKNMRSPLTTIRTDSAVNRLAVSATSGIIAIPHDNRHIRLFDLNGVRIGRLPRSNRLGHSRMVCATSWQEKDNAVCNLYSCGFDRHVYGWKVDIQNKD